METDKQVKGLRTNESEKFVRFFEVVQEFASKNNCVFYLDAGDGRDFEDNCFEGEDLMGWLIPKENAEVFDRRRRLERIWTGS